MTDSQIGVIMGATVLTLGTIVLVTVIIQFAATWRARAAMARDEAYRGLAEQAVTARTAAAALDQKLAEELADVRTRLTAIEKMLKEVG